MGIADIGMKTPEMKISGSLTVLSIDITSPTFYKIRNHIPNDKIALYIEP
jgi:hypothetical protein